MTLRIGLDALLDPEFRGYIDAEPETIDRAALEAAVLLRAQKDRSLFLPLRHAPGGRDPTP